MKNRVRVHSDENLVTNAGIWLRDDEDNWVDVRHCVTMVEVFLKVGSPSKTRLQLLPTEVLLEVGLVTPETEIAFADVLRAQGWKVERP